VSLIDAVLTNERGFHIAYTLVCRIKERNGIDIQTCEHAKLNTSPKKIISFNIIFSNLPKIETALSTRFTENIRLRPLYNNPIYIPSRPFTLVDTAPLLREPSLVRDQKNFILFFAFGC
jgi:hypothetical protein